MAQMNFDVNAAGNFEEAFAKFAQAVDKFSRKIDDLGRKRVNVPVDADTAKADAKLDKTAAKADALGKKKVEVKVDIDRDLGDKIAKIGHVAQGLKAIAVPAGLLAFAPAIGGVVGAAVQLSGVLGTLPAALGGLGLAVGAVKIGFDGFSTAIKNGGKDLAALAPNAQAAAKAFRDMGPAWASLKLDVQNRMFADLAGPIRDLGKTYLPILRENLAGVADGFNHAFRGTADFLKTPAVAKDLSGAMGNVREGVVAATRAIQPLVMAFTDIFSVGSKFLPQLGQGFANAAEHFRRFIDQARESGALQTWIANGIQGLKDLGAIISNVAHIFGDAFRGLKGDSQGFLATLRESTAQLREWTKSAQGQETFRALGDTLRTVSATIREVFMTALRELGPVFVNLAPLIQDLAKTTGGLLVEAIKLVAPLLRDFAAFLSANRDTITTLLPLVIAAVGAYKGFGILKDLTGVVGGFLQKLGALPGKLEEGALKAGVFVEKATGSAAAGERLALAGDAMANGMRVAGAALPVLAVGLGGLALTLHDVRDKSEELTQSFIDGSKTWTQAVSEDADQIQHASVVTEMWARSEGALTGELDGNTSGVDANTQAVDNMNKRLEEAKNKGDLVTAAKLEEKRAMDLLNQAIHDHGPASIEAAEAQQHLAYWTDQVRSEEDKAKAATKSHTESIRDQQRAIEDAISADLNYRDAQDRVAAAQAHLTDLEHTGKASKHDLDVATRDVQRSAIDSANAAADLAIKTSGVTTESDKARVGADAYKAELIRLRDGAIGPAKDALQAMIDKLNAIPRQVNVYVTATGEVRQQTVSATGNAGQRGVVATGGILNFADAGIMPGYTPGRDVHWFTSPTGGVLGLSGGEAVMRPEWTHAVGTSYIDGANRAARMGGVYGVQQFNAGQRHYGRGGVVGSDGAFADGGILNWVGTPFPDMPQKAWDSAVQGQINYLKPFAQALARAAEALAASIGGGGTPGSGPVVEQVLKAANERGWGSGAEWAALGQIISHESGWNPNAQNPTSTAYGLFQFLNSTWGSTGIAKTSNPYLQAVAGMRYIGSRYGDPIGAWGFWQAHHWYDQGGLLPPGLTMAMNNTGQNERVLNPEQTRAWDAVRGGMGDPRAIRHLAEVRDEITSLRSEMADVMREVADANPQITVNDTSGDPSETAQKTSLAIRLRR